MATSSSAMQCPPFVFCFVPSIIFALLLQLPPFRNSDQPLGHAWQAFLPLLTTVHAFFCYREKSEFPSLVDACRIVHTHAAIRYPLVEVWARKGPWAGFELTHEIDLCSHEVKPLVHRVDGVSIDMYTISSESSCQFTRLPKI